MKWNPSWSYRVHDAVAWLPSKVITLMEWIIDKSWDVAHYKYGYGPGSKYYKEGPFGDKKE